MPDATKTGWTHHDGQWTVRDMLQLLRSVPENTPIFGGALVREDGILVNYPGLKAGACSSRLG